ncbi:MAG: sigma-70 family RNA polymerase sigma factor [Verrucomicrobiales bacterium]|nr:sigma-70 family RNA polymerase sigma factor [Verrucomicrobiales bacterium]
MKARPNFAIPTRRSLLSKIKNWENHESWQDFYNTYRNLVYSVARTAGLTDAEAQDVVQDTFLQVAKNIPKFHYDPAVGLFKSWLLKTTRWHITNQFRKRPKACESMHRDSGSGRLTPMAERVPDPRGCVLDEQYEEAWKRNLRDAALDRVKSQVKDRQYQAFFLHAVKGRPVKEITSLLGVTPNQVYLAKLRISRLIAREVKRLESEVL